MYCIVQAYLQLVGDYEMTYSQEIAAWIQQQILERTGCSVSIGIAPNLLLAKIATGCAKPKSSQQVTRQSIFQAKPPYKAFMSPVRLSSLPGIGQRYDFFFFF
jgi:nucleotidyltransferase/DNA polymerase involved in DNA repair